MPIYHLFPKFPIKYSSLMQAAGEYMKGMGIYGPETLQKFGL